MHSRYALIQARADYLTPASAHAHKVSFQGGGGSQRQFLLVKIFCWRRHRTLVFIHSGKLRSAEGSRLSVIYMTSCFCSMALKENWEKKTSLFAHIHLKRKPWTISMVIPILCASVVCVFFLSVFRYIYCEQYDMENCTDLYIGRRCTYGEVGRQRALIRFFHASPHSLLSGSHRTNTARGFRTQILFFCQNVILYFM